MRHFPRHFPRHLHRTGGALGATGPTLLTVGAVAVGAYALYKMLGGRGAGGTRVGAVDCGPNMYWDDASQTCVLVSLPMPPTSPAPTCPPGSFYDYFKQQCVPLAPAPKTGWYGGGWGGGHGWGPHHWGSRHHHHYPQMAPPGMMAPGGDFDDDDDQGY
jgi:hypothetical protein